MLLEPAKELALGEVLVIKKIFFNGANAFDNLLISNRKKPYRKVSGTRFLHWRYPTQGVQVLLCGEEVHCSDAYPQIIHRFIHRYWTEE